jgi:hypothetical protein
MQNLSLYRLAYACSFLYVINIYNLVIRTLVLN